MLFRLKNMFSSRRGRARREAKDIVELAEPFLCFVQTLATHGLNRNVPVWDLSNMQLRKFISYIGGILDVADYTLKAKMGKSRGDTLGLYLAFYFYVEEAFDSLPNVDIFLKESRNFIHYIAKTNLEIAGMPWMVDDESDVYQKLGADDFLSFLRGEAGFFPTGLIEVGIFEERD